MPLEASDEPLEATGKPFEASGEPLEAKPQLKVIMPFLMETERSLEVNHICLKGRLASVKKIAFSALAKV